MPSLDRRAEARRRAWGRGPVILRFEPLEGRALMASSGTSIVASASVGADTSTTSGSTTASTTAAAASGADLVATAFGTQGNLYWGDAVHVAGTIANEGTGTAPAAFKVDIYASTSATLNANSVYVGSVSLPGGLKAGASTNFSQNFFLPAQPLSDIGSSPSFYITEQVDAADAEGESSMADKQGLGQGIDTSVVTITPDQASNLVGDGFQTATTSTTWGSTLQVSAQIQNTGLGNAPATRAEVVATPAGDTPGGLNDVALGSIAIPALPANQSVPVTASIVLPANAPLALSGATQFTLSLVQDADFVANPMEPHTATQGTGLDSETIQITAPTTAGATLSPTALPRPDLTVSSVEVPTTTLIWGQMAQVQATVQNTGSADSGSFQVLFLLANATSPTISQAQVLGTTTVTGLKAGDSQNLLQTIRLPATLAGATPPSTAQGTILVVVNPDHSLDESDLTNNSLASGVVNIALDPAAAAASANVGGTTTTTSTGTTTTTTADGTATTAATTTTSTPATATTSVGTATTAGTVSTATKRIIAHQAEVAVKAAHVAQVAAAKSAHQAAVAAKVTAKKAALSVKLKTVAASLKIHK